MEPKYRSDGSFLQELVDMGHPYYESWDDLELCRSEGEAYARAYLLNGGPDI